MSFASIESLLVNFQERLCTNVTTLPPLEGLMELLLQIANFPSTMPLFTLKNGLKFQLLAFLNDFPKISVLTKPSICILTCSECFHDYKPSAEYSIQYEPYFIFRSIYQRNLELSQSLNIIASPIKVRCLVTQLGFHRLFSISQTSILP